MSKADEARLMHASDGTFSRSCLSGGLKNTQNCDTGMQGWAKDERVQAAIMAHKQTYS